MQGLTVVPFQRQEAALFYLGNYTRFASNPADPDGLTVEDIGSEAPHTLTGRALRFFLQSAARVLMPNERVADCLRVPLILPDGPAVPSVRVLYSPKVKTAHYGNVMTCGSVWMCPCCAAKIAERRRQELQTAIENHTASGGSFVLLTYTVRHHSDDKLDVILSGLREAHRKVKSGRAYKDFKARVGHVGSITSLEVTHSKRNGWHPHIHELFFVDSKAVNWGSAWAFLQARWANAVRSVGLKAVNEHGVGLEIGRSEKETLNLYLTKQGNWDISAEMTRATTKKARGEAGRTPASILYDFALWGDLEDGDLWREYAATFKGRKHLVWTKGLRARLLPDSGEELTDEELAALSEQDAIPLVELSLQQWRVIVRRGLRARLLDVADSGDASRVWSWLREHAITPDPILNPFEIGFNSS